MEATIKIRKRISSLLLALTIAVTMFTDILPGMVIPAKADKAYKVLLWVPYRGNSVAEKWCARVTDFYNGMTDIKVAVNKKEYVLNLTRSDLSGVDLVYIMPTNGTYSMTLLGTDNCNVSLLRDFVNSGGRIIMNGENEEYSRVFNAALTELAQKIGGNFTITTEISFKTDVVLNPAKSELTQGCEKFYPNKFAHIEAIGDAEWVMKDKDNKVFVVDQKVGKGYITAISDGDWLYPAAPDTPAATNAAKQFLKNILVDSAQNIETVSNPTITGPQNLEWDKGDSTARVLSVTATANTVGTFSYQWYKGTTANFEVSESTKISGATGASYTIPNTEKMDVGTFYYKCVITNTIGTISVSTTSNAATVKVKYVAPPEPTPEPTPEPIEEGFVEVDIVKSDDTPDISVSGLTEDIATSVATDEEKDAINKGANGRLWLEITNIDNTVTEEDRKLISNQAKLLNNAKIGMFMDFSMYFQLDGGDRRKITKLDGKKIKVAVSVPENMRATGLKKRTFYLISIHNDVLRIHGSTASDTINANIYDFSTYAIVYADEEEQVFEANITIKQTTKKIIVNWDKVRDVGKVDLYLAYCGTKYTKKPTKTTRSRKVAITSLKGKKLNQKKNYKMYLVAYDRSGKRIGKTLSCHFAGKNCKYTNPKKLKLSTKRLTVKVGQSAKIKASITYEDKKKKPLSEKHAARFRYISDVPEIVAVDKTGKVTGISPGTCDVYVCLQNGMSKCVSVTVKE